MLLPTHRTTLDLLDAHLEALWGGIGLPLPRALVGLAAEGGGRGCACLSGQAAVSAGMTVSQLKQAHCWVGVASAS